MRESGEGESGQRRATERGQLEKAGTVTSCWISKDKEGGKKREASMYSVILYVLCALPTCVSVPVRQTACLNVSCFLLHFVGD